MAEFLFEIGLEEVPARMIAGAQAELQRRVVAMLERERLVAAGTEAASYSTPRRLAPRSMGTPTTSTFTPVPFAARSDPLP